MRTLSDCTLAVLAGGQGSRMGRPKGLLTIGGRPILTHLLHRLAWPGPTLLVTAPGRERPPGCEGFDAEAIDPVADEGPLRGVLTALKACRTPLLAVTTVDMPGMGRAQFEWLANQLGDEDRGVMCDRPAGDRRQLEPFPLLLRPTAIDVVRERLAQRRRSVHALATEAGFGVRPAPAAWADTVWVNLNTPADVARFDPRIRDGTGGRASPGDRPGEPGQPGRR
jgi:molybdopterin-guanine dinucleotide biosynthesis protein A